MALRLCAEPRFFSIFASRKTFWGIKRDMKRGVFSIFLSTGKRMAVLVATTTKTEGIVRGLSINNVLLMQGWVGVGK